MKGKPIFVMLFFLILLLMPVSSGQWNEINRLTYSGSAEQQVSMIDDENHIHLIFQEYLGGRILLRYMKLDEGGISLVPTRTIVSGTGESIHPAAGLDVHGIHVVWWDSRSGNFRLYYTLLNHNGSRVMIDRPLNVEMADDRSPAEAPRVALDPFGNLYVVWSQRGKDPDTGMNEEELALSVFFMKLDREGNVIIPQLRISSGYANGIHPDIVLDDLGRAHVVWSEDLTGNYEVYYTIIDDETSPEDRELNIVRLTETPMESVMSRLVYHTDQLFICWSDGDSAGDIYSLHFGRIGRSRLTLDIVISGEGNAIYPSIASFDSRIFISWQDDRHSLAGSDGRDAYEEMRDNITSFSAYIRRHISGDQGFDSGSELTNWEIYLSVINTHGKTLVGNSRITTMPRASIRPDLTLDGLGNARLIWVDSVKSSGDLYYIAEQETEVEDGNSVLDPTEESLLLVGGIGILLLVYIFFGEGRRYAFFKILIAPFYSTISRDRLMENENRRQIVALINEQEGITFTALMDELGLKNGALAYHLYTLERRRYIKSVKDGKYRRFYPRGAIVSGFSSLEERIIAVIKENPSISQREIANIIDSTPQTVNYNIKKLIKRGVVYLKKDGKHSRCNLTNLDY